MGERVGGDATERPLRLRVSAEAAGRESVSCDVCGGAGCCWDGGGKK